MRVVPPRINTRGSIPHKEEKTVTQEPITLFAWGYWGWGNSTGELVECVDAVEHSRGFAPPVFVDIRIQRAVRAVGFNGNAFEETVKQPRYHWMSGLGNQAIVDHSLRGVRIKDPKAANNLLNLALDLAKQNQRTLFFCSCEAPYADGKPFCHRVAVANLVIKYARQRHESVQVVEWPGSAPQMIDLKVAPEITRKLRHGQKNMTLDEPVALAQYAGLGWGSVVRAHSEEGEIAFRTGPARRANDAWCLPVLTDPTDPSMTPDKLFASAAQWQRKNGYAARLVTKS